MKGTWRAGSSTNQRAQANTCNCKQILIYSYIADNIDILSPYFQSTHQDHVDIRSQTQLHFRQDHGGTTKIVNLISKVGWYHMRKNVTNRSFSKWFVRDPQVRSKKSPSSWNILTNKPGEDLEPSAYHWDSACLLDTMITRKVKTNCDQNVYLMLSGQRDSK